MYIDINVIFTLVCIENNVLCFSAKANVFFEQNIRDSSGRQESMHGTYVLHNTLDISKLFTSIEFMSHEPRFRCSLVP